MDVLVEEVEDKIFLVDVGEIDEGGIVDGFYDLEFFSFLRGGGTGARFGGGFRL